MGFIIITLIVGMVVTGYAEFKPGGDSPSTRYATNRIIIRPKSFANRSQLQALHASVRSRVKHEMKKLRGIQVIELAPGEDPIRAVDLYRKSGLVEYAELDYEIHTLAIPNDPAFTNQWALANTGQDGGTPGVDIDATNAWDIQTDASSVIVAVVDTGIRLDHQDFVGELWTNPGETAANGIDDDGDGYIDDVHGINAITGTGDPSDDEGHGTHVSGIIGARGNDGHGISGVAWKVQIMPLKFMNSSGGGSTSDAIECLEYAAAHGANIVNASWGNYVYEQSLYDAIDSLRTNGIIFVAAAGNDNADTDHTFGYPSCYWLDNIVTVGAMTSSNTLAYFSTYGDLSVDIVSPGVNIISTYYLATNNYAYLSGTSMAAPHVAGALALLKANCPNESYLALINRLLSGVDRSAVYQDKILSGGSLNIFKALQTTVASSPDNDSFSNRVAISGPNITVYGNTLGATKESGEPNHAGNSGGHSVWWEWEPRSPGRYEITTAKSVTSNGVPMNTLLGVYSGTSVGSLTLVASNDDSGITEDGSVCSRVFVDVPLPLAKYEIAVDGYGGVQGFVKLAVRATPRNDALSDALKINGRSIAAEGWTMGASKESGEAAHAGNSGGRSVWWSWLAPLDGDVVLSTAGSDFDTTLAVYTGNAFPLSLVASNNDFTGSLDDHYGGKTAFLAFTATKGQTYQIAVDGKDGAFGHVRLAGAYKYSLNSPNQNESVALGINGNGEVSGTSFSPDVGYLLSDMYYTISTPTNGTYGFGVNESGQVCGQVDGGGLTSSGLPFVWDRNTGMTALNRFASYVSGWAYALNDSQVTGGSCLNTVGGFLQPQECYWIGTNIYALQTAYYASNAWGAVQDVNAESDLAGWGYDDSGFFILPFYAKAGQADPHTHVLETLGGLESVGFGINNGGEIVGQAQTVSTPSHAALWYDERIHDIANPGVGYYAMAEKINERHQAVGGYYPGSVDDAHHRGFLWQNGVYIDVNRLANLGTNGSYSWEWLGPAHDINNPGIIVGQGQIQGPGGEFTGSFILTPVAAVRLENSQFAASGAFEFDVTGPANQRCVVEYSTNLLLGNWQPVALQFISSTGSMHVTDPNSISAAVRFYRASVGSVRSDNAVGFLRRTISTGASVCVGYPFFAEDNRVPAALSNAPIGFIVEKFDERIQDYRYNTNTPTGWTDPQMTLRPGEGAFVLTPTNYQWNAFGEIVPNCVNTILSTNTLVSSPFPIAGQVDTDLQLPMARQEQILKWGGTTWNTSLYGAGGWSSTPTMGVGEGFMAGKRRQTIWIQNVPLWSGSTGDIPSPSWSTTGSLSAGRAVHTATLLTNGLVLVAGGVNSSGWPTTCELYDPVAGTWSTTGSLNSGRAYHTATLLLNGKVLVTGGSTFSDLTSCELYDPSTGTWSLTGSLNNARDSHTATLLANGKVLVSGGLGGSGDLTSCEIYDPSTGVWTSTGSLNTARDSHSATLLNNGKVLVAGGYSYSSSGELSSAELYDPSTGTWTTTGSLNAGRFYFAIVHMPDDKVLVVGGGQNSGNLSSAELYNPATGTWSTTGSLGNARALTTATPLPDGTVVAAAGQNSAGSAISSVEVYNPVTGTWSTSASLNTARYSHTATLLQSGNILIVGGQNSSGLVSSAELYQ